MYLIARKSINGGVVYLDSTVSTPFWTGRVSDARSFVGLATAELVAFHQAGYVVYASSLKIVGEKHTIQDIKEANARMGMYFFEKKAMRFFSSRILAQTFDNGANGVFFVTSERGPNGVRAYSVRKFLPTTGDIETVGEFQGYATRKQAMTAAFNASMAPSVA